MSSTSLVGQDLFQALSQRFPQIRMGNGQGMSTVSPKDAVFFDFDFVVDSEKIASVSISLADKGSLKLFYSKDILKDQEEHVKRNWYKFLKDMRSFSMSRLLSFDPKDIVKKSLDKRDYQSLASDNKDKDKDFTMNESSLYGSTRSSYQALENTKLIIRHSKKIQEESPASRTRNIEALYIQNEDGERFKYPFVHLAGARAMQRHVANNGNPYDSFGQYIVSLSEQIFNLRKFNNLVSRNSFLENIEVMTIAESAKQKAHEIKKVLERIQKQGGYNDIKENFTIFVKKEIDEVALENLKNRFTVQQFNEELVELFPYISDLIGESKFETKQQVIDHFVKQGKTAAQGASAWERGWRGPKKKKAELSTKEPRTDWQHKWEKDKDLEEVSDKLAKKVQFKRAQNYAAADNNPTGGSPQEEKAWEKYKKNTALMAKRHATEAGGTQSVGWPQDDVSEALPKQTDPLSPDELKDYRPEEPWDIKRYGSDTETERNEISDLENTIHSMKQIEIEPYSKEFIQKALDITQRQIKDLEKKQAENPKDNKIKWALEKAQARLGVMQARLASADPQASNVITKNGLMIDHLAKHIKNDTLSLLLSRIGEDYADLSKAEQKKVVELIKLIKSKQKLVSPFTAESTTFEELQNLMNVSNIVSNENRGSKYDPLGEYIDLLNGKILESSELQSSDEDVRKQAIDKLNRLMAHQFPVGTNGINAIESLSGIIDDPELNDEFKSMSQKDSNIDARPIIVAWIEKNASDVSNQIQMGDIDKEEPGTNNDEPVNPDYHDQDDKRWDDAEPATENENECDCMTQDNPENAEGSAEIEEFVKSLYDYTTGKFPRGETGVIESVRKKFGDGSVDHAKAFIEELKNNFEENLHRMKKISGSSETVVDDSNEMSFENLERIKSLSGL
jgi:hypothetical protein